QTWCSRPASPSGGTAPPLPPAGWPPGTRLPRPGRTRAGGPRRHPGGQCRAARPVGRTDRASCRVVEDDAEGVPPAGADPADAVAHVDPVGAPAALDRTMMDREDHGIALAERHHLGARLPARSLLGEDE